MDSDTLSTVSQPVKAREDDLQFHVRSALDDVVTGFHSWMHVPDVVPLYATLGTVAANYARGDPVWLMIVASPGSGKTEVLNSIGGLADVHSVSTLTESSLLSGTPRKDKSADASGGLLREVGSFGLLVLKDFGSLLSMHRDRRSEVIAALREIYDGAWTRRVGSEGGRSLHWEGKLGLLTGCTHAIDRAHAVVSALGERFLQVRLPREDATTMVRFAVGHRGRIEEMRSELGARVCNLFQKVRDFKTYETEDAFTEEEIDRLADLANLVTLSRSAVDRDFRGEIDNIHGSESPGRLGKTLAQLYVGLRAVGLRVPGAWDVVRRVALDSIPGIRRRVLDTLVDGMTWNTSNIAAAIDYPRATTRRALEDLQVHGVLRKESGGPGRADSWWMDEGLRDVLARYRGTVPGTVPDGIN